MNMRQLIDLISSHSSPLKNPSMDDKISLLDSANTSAPKKFAFLNAPVGPMMLTEAVDVKAMFKNLLDKIPENEKAVISKKISDQIVNIRRTLGKENRVVWFLRIYRLGFANYLAKRGFIDHSVVEKMRLEMDKRAKDYGDLATADTVFKSQTYLHSLEHFLSLPIQAILNNPFEGYSLSSLLEEFTKEESEWKQTAKEYFVPKTEDKPIMNFDGGWAWWLLDRPYCKQEGDASGHCGNSASYKHGDRLLSLRKSMTFGGRLMVRPSLTFILGEDGKLGEMKGRGNEKPAAKYHPYIVALLKDTDLITGIKGGGYLSSHNFSLNDLDSDERDELLDTHPHLENYLIGLRKKFGDNSEEVRDEVYSYLGEKHIAPDRLVISGNQYILKEWRSFKHFADDLYNDGLSYIVELLDDSDARKDLIEKFDAQDVTEEETMEVLSALDDRSLKVAASLLNIGYSAPNTTGFPRMISRMVSFMNHNSEWNEIVEDAISESVDLSDVDDALVAMLQNRVREYIDAGFYFKSHYVYVSIDGIDEDEFDADKPVELKIGITDMVELVEVDMSGDNGDYSEYSDLSNFSHDENWDTLSDDGSNWTYEHKLQDNRGVDLVFGTERNPKDPFVGSNKTDVAQNDGQFELTSPVERKSKINVRLAAHLIAKQLNR